MGRPKLNRFRFAFKPKMSKQEEIEAIQEFVSVLPKDSYLHLILGGIEKYCEQQIEDDFGMNVMESVLHWDREREFWKISKELTELKTALAVAAKLAEDNE